MLDPEIFVAAAERLATRGHGGVCAALILAGIGESQDDPWAYSYDEAILALEFFKALFQPETNEDGIHWWKYEDLESRLLALLLAAEIAKENHD